LSQARPALREQIEQATPRLRAYERLASVYHEYARSFCPNYVPFLAELGKKHGVTCQSVLDLACGAGTLTTQLGASARRVVGLDISDTMLEAARALCRHQRNVCFVQADYRDFDLQERFDAVVCASDSINYLDDPTQLTQVFRSVSRHLNPSGLFVFDALDDRGMRLRADLFIPIEHDGTRCSIVLRYDPETRVQNALVVFGDEMELHRRIPIEPADVQSAADRCGFLVLDWFSLAGFGLLKYGGIRNFFVLQ
jgi:SAM-dependent methyltransferase